MKCCLVLVLCLSLLHAPSASTFIPDVVFGHGALTERRLLQAKKPCPVNFEVQNYTIITSQCKGPDYSPKPCCSAFKQFACPFADELNDSSNKCADTMFSYINLQNIPTDLFSSFCREGKDGLQCPDEAASTPSSPLSEKTADSSASVRTTCQLWTAVILLTATLVLSLQRFT